MRLLSLSFNYVTHNYVIEQIKHIRNTPSLFFPIICNELFEVVRLCRFDNVHPIAPLGGLDDTAF